MSVFHKICKEINVGLTCTLAFCLSALDESRTDWIYFPVGGRGVLLVCAIYPLVVSSMNQSQE